MSDRLHDHTTIGHRRGCVACAQTEADLALCHKAALEAGRVADTPEHAHQ